MAATRKAAETQRREHHDYVKTAKESAGREGREGCGQAGGRVGRQIGGKGRREGRREGMCLIDRLLE